MLGRNRFSVGVMALILALLSSMPSLIASGDQAENKPPKPRFERSGLLLKDNKADLAWSLNADIGGRTFSWDDAQDYLVRLNLESYAGCSDWRVPSLEEINSLINHVRSLGFTGGGPNRTVAAGLRELGFQNVQPDGYWTSTTNMYDSGEAWYVIMTDGASSLGDKNLYFSVWPVRSER